MRSAKSGPNLWQFDKFLAHGQAHRGQMGKLPWQCTTTGLDNSIELRMEKIRQAVTEIWVPQVWQPPARPPTHPPEPWRQYPSSPKGWGVKNSKYKTISRHYAMKSKLVPTPGGWGYSVQKLIGVCRWPLKTGPKKTEGKWNVGPKRSNSVRISSFKVPKRSFLCWCMRKKYPKKIEFNPQNVKKGGQNGGTAISPNIEGVAPLPPPTNFMTVAICQRRFKTTF